ncbi:response regulator [Bradyrhizobium sp. DOA9]|uniref:response regulator n=1 Tax=Bradyrhizobium sp. DOA9 TaxID=1126627 RepID=UPI00046A4151|nr:response regulator transcription factor [Bradyrhizobium sp. DOA9]
MRVLLAHGQIVVRRDLRALIEARENFEVCAETSNGPDAVELALQHQPDVAILDIALPIMDGIEVTRQIRKETRRTEIMIFAMRDSTDKIFDALEAGARGYVFKSEAGDRIVEAIRTLARGGAFFSSRADHIANAFNAVEPQFDSHPTALTIRECDVVRLIAEGKSNKHIARLLDISVKTVETHRSSSMRKLSVHSTAELVRYAIRCRLILP